jgi:uncharacterized membrane protein YhaH (DUF805 family)
MELMFQPLKRYADFNGRSRRTEYWLWFLFQIIASIVFSLLKSVIGNTAEIRTGWWILFPFAVFVVAMVVFFSINGAGFLNNMKSFADMGPNPTPDQAMVMLTALAPMAWVFLVWFAAGVVTFVFQVTDGTPGPNRFGPDPKGRGGDSSVF